MLSSEKKDINVLSEHKAKLTMGLATRNMSHVHLSRCILYFAVVLG